MMLHGTIRRRSIACFAVHGAADQGTGRYSAGTHLPARVLALQDGAYLFVG